MRYDGDSQENGPKYLTRSGPYHGLPDDTFLDLAAVLSMVTRPSPIRVDEDGLSLTAWPTKEGKERAIVDEAIWQK